MIFDRAKSQNPEYTGGTKIFETSSDIPFLVYIVRQSSLFYELYPVGWKPQSLVVKNCK